MHLTVRLPKVEPTRIPIPMHCPLPARGRSKKRCSGTQFKLHQVICRKSVRDTRYAEVIAHRYRCLKCQRSFRVYPRGVSNDHQSDTLKALSVLLYVLGLSYQGVADLLESLDQPICKVTVYNNVQMVADHLGLQHQICRAHVNRNVHDLVAALGTRALDYPDKVPWELGSQVTVDQFIQDLTTLEWLIKSMPYNGPALLQELAARYQGAPPPPQGGKATMWYRMRLLTLDWSENWARLALYQHWRGDANEKLDGTNNASEQNIGGNVKERYRTMRSYKRDESILNVSSLIGWMRAQGPDYEMDELFK